MGGALTCFQVPFLPGYWIVNLGTDLYRWAQQSSLAAPGRVRKCKATLHRVVPRARSVWGGAGGGVKLSGTVFLNRMRRSSGMAWHKAGL